MRRLLLATFAVALSVAPALAEPTLLVVRMDQATRLMLSRPARDVIVANPAIADVSVLDARSIVVTGKAVGTTSLLVVDPAGRTITDRQVIVSSSDEGRMSYYRGGGPVQDFACSPRCGRIAPQGEAAVSAPAGDTAAGAAPSL